jgi:hypothetical protein
MRIPVSRVNRLLGLAIVIVALSATGVWADSQTLCTVTPGGHVVLESDAVDPDVFLWDSRERLIDYAAGQWGDTRAIFAHTVLAEPGTQAMVVACFPSVAHPKFSTGDEDAIGVKIMSGPHRGRYGWVLSSDIHLGRGPTGQSAVNSNITRN